MPEAQDGVSLVVIHVVLCHKQRFGVHRLVEVARESNEVDAAKEETSQLNALGVNQLFIVVRG